MTEEERKKKLEFDKKLCKYYTNKLNSSEQRKLSFELSFDEVRDLLQTEYCAYSGKKLVSIFSDEQSKTRLVTLERINPCAGYTIDNVVAVTVAANTHKSQLDAFVKGTDITDEMKIKLLRKATYQLEKKLKNKN